ncbi:MAG: DUF1513 domain-containing protein [Bacteriovoracaceae bacterium]
MNRRELFHSFAALMALQGCRPIEFFSEFKEGSKDWFYSGLVIDPSSTGGKNRYAVAATIDSETRIFPLENEIHSVAYDPTTKLKVFLPKSGASAFFQIGDEKPKVFRPDQGNYFYGHGAFDVKRKAFYTTQSLITNDGPSENRKNNKGHIYVHSLDNFRIIDKFPTFGNDPHDIKMVGGEIVVCNGGTDSNVSFIDPASRKLSQSFPLKDERLSFGHIDVLDDKTFALVTGAYHAADSPALFLLHRDQGLKKFSFPQGLASYSRVQLLSVAHFENYILATCPHTDSLFVWSRSGEFLHIHHIVDALSLAVSPALNGVIVGSGQNDQPLRLVTFSNNQVQIRPLEWGLRSTGAHSIVI